MKTVPSDRLRDFQVPQWTAMPVGHCWVVRLIGLGFERRLDHRCGEGPAETILEVGFAKQLVRVATHFLGGDVCGIYAHVELTEISVLLNAETLLQRWEEASDFQNYIVSLASAKMSREAGEDRYFICRVYAFSTRELVPAYFAWRQQEGSVRVLDTYCRWAIGNGTVTGEDRREGSRDHGQPTDTPHPIRDRGDEVSALGLREKKKVLENNGLKYRDIPTWQRNGVGVYLKQGELVVDTSLPYGDAYIDYVGAKTV